jgi:hypothetical protein
VLLRYFGRKDFVAGDVVELYNLPKEGRLAAELIHLPDKPAGVWVAGDFADDK